MSDPQAPSKYDDTCGSNLYLTILPTSLSIELTQESEDQLRQGVSLCNLGNARLLQDLGTREARGFLREVGIDDA